MEPFKNKKITPLGTRKLRIRGVNPVTELQRIQQFLDDHQTLDPTLKKLTEHCVPHYEQKLIDEYVRLGTHPYPQEELNLHK